MTADTLPIANARQGQILDQLRAGPKTAAEIAKVLSPSWFKTDPDGATSRQADVLAGMAQTGSVREIEGGKFEIVPESDGPTPAEDESGTLGESGTNGAAPTDGPAEQTDTENIEMATATAPKKRGRPKKNPDANGAGTPAVAEATAKQQPLGMKLSGAEHLEAISAVESELAEAKLAYEDALNARRMAAAALGVARIERRRFGAHEGSSIAEIQAAQKKVRKKENEYNKAQAEANELKNKVKSVDEKLSRAIEGERELFSSEDDSE